MGKGVAVLNSSEGVKGTIFFTQEGDGTFLFSLSKYLKPFCFGFTSYEMMEIFGLFFFVFCRCDLCDWNSFWT